MVLDLTYALLPQISMGKKNTIKPLLSTSNTHLPILIYSWTIATMMMIIIPQISQKLDHYMPLLGDYRSYRDFTYALLPQISMVKTNIAKPLQCSSYTH